jgi:hypothetical protein
MNTPRIVSKEKPIAQEDFGTNTFIASGSKRDIAHEEAARDLEKSPEHILVDIHDESLDRQRAPEETIGRALARLGSLQLRVQKEVEKQASESAKLNSSIQFLTKVILFFTVVGALAAAAQVYFAATSR